MKVFIIMHVMAFTFGLLLAIFSFLLFIDFAASGLHTHTIGSIITFILGIILVIRNGNEL